MAQIRSVLHPKNIGQFTIPTTNALTIAVTESTAITVPNCPANSVIIATFPDMTANVIADAYVSAANSVKIRLCNPTAGNISVASKLVNIIVL